ncbi:MAG: glycosyltransferase [Nitrososphaeraceae archaeon]
MPVYNAEKYLKECIDSAINQTYPDIEIITVIDDGSTDRSLEILQKYSDKIKILYKERGRAALALNAGIKAAKGEWIKRLDSDDVLYPHAVDDLISEAKNLKDKKNTMLYANYDIIDSKGKLINHMREPNYNELDAFHFNVILMDHHIGLSDSTLIHKSTMEDYGMFDESSHIEDYDLHLRYCLLHNCRMHLVEKTVARYRIHQTSVTRTKIRKSLEEQNKVRSFVLHKLNSVEREKYEIALKKYRKSRPTIAKITTYVRYHILPLLPTFISVRIIMAYWHMKGRKMQPLYFTK